jgi:predicted outer membrane repeat protein
MKKILFSILLVFLTKCLLAQGVRYHVDADAAGQSNGSSWVDAFTDLHDALALAQSGDEVWVAEGVYYPSDLGDRTARFQLLSGVRLYGGFSGTELDLSERDWAAHPSILSGDIGVPDDSTDNSYNLLYVVNPDTTTRIDGLVFRDALANQTGTPNGQVGASGAALYIMGYDGIGYPDVWHCQFEHNTALHDGGAVYVNGGGSGSVAPFFFDCTLTRNRTIGGVGAALYRSGGSWYDQPFDLLHCRFVDNIGYLTGSCIGLSDAQRSDSIHISNCYFTGNATTTTSFEVGSGMIDLRTLRIPQTYLILDSLLVEENNTRGFMVKYLIGLELDPGGLWYDLSNTEFHDRPGASFSGYIIGYFDYNIKNIKVFDADFSNDMGIGSEGIQPVSTIENINIRNGKMAFSLCGDTVLFRNVFCENTNKIANLRLYSCKLLSIDNLCFVGDTIDSEEGENVEFIQLSSFYYTSGTPCDVEVRNSAFIRSELYYAHNGFSDFLVNNNYFFFDGIAPYISGIYNFIGDIENNTITFRKNIISIPDTFDTTGWITSDNQWNTDPLLVDPDNGDYRLQACSPAINAGLNAGVATTDLLGQPRIQYGTVDIGPIEMGVPEFLVEPSTTPACGAANGSITWLLDACEPITITTADGDTLSGTTGLDGGLYDLIVTDARGRSRVFSIQVAGEVVSPTVVVSPASDSTNADGAIQVSAIEGLEPFSLLWEDGSTAADRSNLLPGLYTLQITDSIGCVYAYVFTVGVVSGTQQVVLTDLQVYPNPSSSWLQVTLGAPFEGQVQVSDASGRVHQSFRQSAITDGLLLDISRLPAGVYTLTCTTSTSVRVGRFVKH